MDYHDSSQLLWLFQDYLNTIIYNCFKRSNSKAQIFILVKNYILHLIFLLGPNKSVFIAIDGIPPLGKIKQQALRRQNSTKLINGMDINMITPGSEFFNEFNLKLHEFAKTESCLKNEDFNIVVSDSLESGEGEQKIMNYLKKIQNSQNLTDKSIIYSVDADIIVMSLILSNNVELIRERNHFHQKHFNYQRQDFQKLQFELLNINQLKIQLTCSFQKVKRDNALKDLCLLFIILGNDFLPSPELFNSNITTDFIHIIQTSLVEFYNNITEKDTINHLILESSINNSNDYEINYLGLIDYFQILSKFQFEQFKKDYPSKSDYLKQRILELEFSNLLSLKEKKIQIQKSIQGIELERFKEWRLLYYKKKNQYGSSISNPQNSKFKILTNEYFVRLNWVFKYYVNGCIDNGDWIFDYDYVPMISDLLENYQYSDMDEFKKHILNANIDLNITPEIHLALVLPSKSTKLLPEKYQNDSKLERYNNENFVDLNYKKILDIVIYLQKKKKKLK
ncbi:hypothetical protein WICMUC_004838 [Wickerhamomyces mucosus]|uniref:Xrn1 N-terminal domain-containing protein n=1 Tax=Wickerhamomyces mucosus TaxID=1378264 RepID=A0A9P8PEF1_9ASCO|nr:hypothetical protein WICMUC_004838 [Wickerhamomyces mucosus]